MEQITLIARFQTNASVTFERLVDPRKVQASGAEMLPVSIHLHGGPEIAVTILAENVQGKQMTLEQLNYFRDALNVEIAKYGHRPLPPDSFSVLSK